jgi:hypothetical protein
VVLDMGNGLGIEDALLSNAVLQFKRGSQANTPNKVSYLPVLTKPIS